MLPDEVLKRVLKWVFHNGWKWKTSRNEGFNHYEGVDEKSLDDGAKHFLMLREVSLRFRELIAECYFCLWHWQVDNTQQWYEWTRMTEGHVFLKEHYTPGEMRLFFKSRVLKVWSVRTDDDNSTHLDEDIKRDDCLHVEDVERKPSEILAHPVLLRQDMPELNVPNDELTVQFWTDRRYATEARCERHVKMRDAESEQWHAQLPLFSGDFNSMDFQQPFQYYGWFFDTFSGQPTRCVIPNWLPDDLCEIPYQPRWTKTAAASRAALEDYERAALKEHEAIDRCSGCSTEVVTLGAKFCWHCGAVLTRRTKGFEVGSNAQNSPPTLSFTLPSTSANISHDRPC